MRYYCFLFFTILFFILALGAVISIEMPKNVFITHIVIWVVCMSLAFLSFNLKDKTLKELFLNLKKDLKMDDDYI